MMCGGTRYSDPRFSNILYSRANPSLQLIHPRGSSHEDKLRTDPRYSRLTSDGADVFIDEVAPDAVIALGTPEVFDRFLASAPPAL